MQHFARVIGLRTRIQLTNFLAKLGQFFAEILPGIY
jgi:hypothetical protein